VRVAFYGLGACGRMIAREAAVQGHEVVAGVDGRPAAPTSVNVPGVGVIGVVPATALVAGKRPEVVIHATPRDSDLESQLLDIVRAGCNVISISGVAHLWRRNPLLAVRLDCAAREAGVSIIGSGINPGFMLDLAPIFFLGVCTRIMSVRATRVADLSPWGVSVGAIFGLGLTPEAFDSALVAGKITLHEELLQSLDVMADALGWGEFDLVEKRSAVIAQTARRGEVLEVEAGHVCGFRQALTAESGGRSIQLELVCILQPSVAEDGVEPGLTIEIEGAPSLRVKVNGGISGESSTALIARVVNLLSWIADAPPGLLRLSDLPAGLVPRDQEERNSDADPMKYSDE
jgi:2,4-diaminopentanoate dehydrogenase